MKINMLMSVVFYTKNFAMNKKKKKNLVFVLPVTDKRIVPVCEVPFCQLESVTHAGS